MYIYDTLPLLPTVARWNPIHNSSVLLLFRCCCCVIDGTVWCLSYNNAVISWYCLEYYDHRHKEKTINDDEKVVGDGSRSRRKRRAIDEVAKSFYVPLFRCCCIVDGVVVMHVVVISWYCLDYRIMITDTRRRQLTMMWCWWWSEAKKEKS